MTTGALILERLEAAGLHVRAEGGKLIARPKEAVTDDLRGLMREHKAELLAELEPRPEADKLPDQAAEARRQRVLAVLASNPSLRLAVVCDGEGDPVPIAIAIRDKGTCEVLIPAARFDSFDLWGLIEQHGNRLEAVH